MLDDIRIEMHQAHLLLFERGLFDHFRGTLSAFDRQRGLILVRPQGVDFRLLTPSDYVVLSGSDGRPVEGQGSPATDLDGHLAVYRGIREVQALITCHSHYATVWAQAGKSIPCLGMAHAQYFGGEIPLCPPPEDAVVSAREYYSRRGEQVVRHFRDQGLDPVKIPGILLHGDGPMTFGGSCMEAANNAICLEAVARLALDSQQLNPSLRPIDPAVAEVIRTPGRSARGTVRGPVRGTIIR